MTFCLVLCTFTKTLAPLADRPLRLGILAGSATCSNTGSTSFSKLTRHQDSHLDILYFSLSSSQESFWSSV